jgi:hypothetical protein
MMKTRVLVASLVVALTFGCAWSRGRVRHYVGENIKEDIHCWTIVIGKGRLGAQCTPKRALLASEDTGLNPETVKAISEGVIEGLKMSSGVP